MTRPDENTLEPWPGYAAQSEDERLQTLEHKVGDSRRRGDLLYALAVSSAVAATEALARGDGERTNLERAAFDLGQEIHKDGPSHFESWTPK